MKILDLTPRRRPRRADRAVSMRLPRQRYHRAGGAPVSAADACGTAPDRRPPAGPGDHASAALTQRRSALHSHLDQPR